MNLMNVMMIAISMDVDQDHLSSFSAPAAGKQVL
jgi:hypothetical protein